MRALVLMTCLLAVTAPARAQDGGVVADEAPDAGPPPEPAPADPEAQRTAIARALFEEGLALADRGQWARAADRFRRAAAVRVSPPIHFNLAQSLGRLGRIIEAIELLHGIEADRRADAGVRASARELRARLETKLGHVTIEVEEIPPAAHIELDEVTLPGDVAGVALPVDPGSHRIRLIEDDAEVDASTIEVGEGETITVSLSTPGRSRAEDELLLEQPWFWAAIGMVVASGVIAALVIVNADDSSATSAPLFSF